MEFSVIEQISISHEIYVSKTKEMKSKKNWMHYLSILRYLKTESMRKKGSENIEIFTSSFFIHLSI